MQRLQRLPRIRCDQALHLVPAMSRPVLRSLLRGHLNMKSRTHRKIVNLRLGQLLQPLRRIYPARGKLRCSDAIRRRILLLFCLQLHQERVPVLHLSQLPRSLRA